MESMQGARNANRSNKQKPFCPGFILIAAVGVKITQRQQKVQDKFAKERDCLNFASVKHHHHEPVSVVVSMSIIVRWSVGPGSDLLMCSTGKHGTNTWAR